MTESEWLASDDPAQMLREPMFGYGTAVTQRASDRKLRLFAVACCRLPDTMTAMSACSIASVEMAERFADGDPTALGLRTEHGDWTCTPDGLRSMLRFVTTHKNIDKRLHAALLRDICGNPFRPVTLPVTHRPDCDALSGAAERAYSHCSCHCPWLTPAVLSLAQAAYEDNAGRECPHCKHREKKGLVHKGGSIYVRCGCDKGRIRDGSLDPQRLLVLSDALEEAGCPIRVKCPVCNGDDGPTTWPCAACDPWRHVSHPLLAHLRSPGPHVRGCWALDLILGKE